MKCFAIFVTALCIATAAAAAGGSPLFKTIAGNYTVFDRAGDGAPIAYVDIRLQERGEGAAPAVTMSATDRDHAGAMAGSSPTERVSKINMTSCDVLVPMIVSQDGDVSRGSVRCKGIGNIWYTVTIAPPNAMIRYQDRTVVHSPSGLFLVIEGTETRQSVYGLKVNDRQTLANR